MMDSVLVDKVLAGMGEIHTLFGFAFILVYLFIYLVIE
jgi:hypothetical protein